MRRIPDRSFVLAGWWLFMVCALLFIWSTARAGDLVALAGSVAFLAANVCFLIPFYRAPRDLGAAKEDPR